MLVILEAHLWGIFYLKMVVFLQKKLCAHYIWTLSQIFRIRHLKIQQTDRIISEGACAAHKFSQAVKGAET